MTDTDRIRRLAEAATPGPWRVILPGDLAWSRRHRYRCVAFGPDRDEPYTTSPLVPADARHIAALDPQTVIALLDRIDALEATVAAGVEAFRLTRDHVGEDALPAIEGWSWFDWCRGAGR